MGLSCEPLGQQEDVKSTPSLWRSEWLSTLSIFSGDVSRAQRAGAAQHEAMSLRDEGCDLEQQPFLGEATLDEKVVGGSPDVKRQGLTWADASCWAFVLLAFAAIMVSSLTALVLSFSARTSRPTRVVFKEALPSSPRLRTVDEYLLSALWDYQAPPTTREYYWTITDAMLNPDGVFRPMILINNQFPGPLVEVNGGDTIVIHISNQGANATAIHFHGMFQNGTNAMDGTVGVTQCPIAPGSNYTYEFSVVGQSGTYWYHAHHSLQASDGLLGPMVVHAPNEKSGLERLGYASDRVVMIQDHYHNTTAELLMDYLQPDRENDEPIPDSALINGRGVRDCEDFPGWECDNSTLGLQVFDLERGRRHRLRIINVGAFAEFQIEVDEHPFYITEVDGTDVRPEPFHRLNILPAQRYSIVIEANASSTDSFWLRGRMITNCFRGQNPHLNEHIRATLRYVEGDDSPAPPDPLAAGAPRSKPWNEVDEVFCRDLDTTALHPVLERDAPPADTYVYLRASFRIGDWRLARGFFNGSTWHGNATRPSLHRFLDAADDAGGAFGVNGRVFDPARELVLQTEGVRTLDVVIKNFDDGAHPFHLHGHKFFVLSPALEGYPPAEAELAQWLEGSGATQNPLLRDTVTLGAYQWVVLRVVLDNPGLWAFHCHNAWHAEAGMVMQFLVMGEEVRRRGVGPAEREICSLEGVENGGRPDDSIWFGDFGK